MLFSILISIFVTEQTFEMCNVSVSNCYLSLVVVQMFTVSSYSEPMMVKLHSGMSRHVEDPEMLWVMGPVLAVVLIVVIVIAILLFKRYRVTLLYSKYSFYI